MVKLSNPSALKVDEYLHGFQVVRIAPLEGVEAVFHELKHLGTGARWIHIASEDRENAFAVGFKTVPRDSTGVAHILEHTALCGSERFPVRDPFFSMIRRSLSTFMNAFTAPDWTLYPFATQSEKDFYNLLEVYLDAVFFPKLSPLSFKQEGWRAEFEGTGERPLQRLVFKGVVYNEMKGAMSSPREVMNRSITKALYPTTTYGQDSGGDPLAITSLTHRQLKDFHRTHYHPSNGFFYSYGSLPVQGHLRFLQNNFLSRFSEISPGTDVSPEVRWDVPREVSAPYPSASSDGTSKKSQVAWSWLACPADDSLEVLALSLLESILLGNAGSPLRKALIDSRLGSALSDGTGFEPGYRDTMFSCGLKDVDLASKEAVSKIVFDVLDELVSRGIDRELIEIAIHRLEFRRKEVTHHPYPYGLKLLLSFFGPWLHHADPLRHLRFDEDLERIREALKHEPFFERRIRRFFLDNPHRLLLTLYPDPHMQEEQDRRIGRRLATIQRRLTPEEHETIMRDARDLRALQDDKEDLACLPTLEMQDIPVQVQESPPVTSLVDGNIRTYVQPTNGVYYFMAVADARTLPQRLYPLAPFFCHALWRVGSARRGYAELARAIDAHTGGIALGASARTLFVSGRCLPWLTFDAKCLARNRDKMFQILEELLTAVDFSDVPRLRNCLLEYRAGLKSNLIQIGHRLALSRAAMGFSAATRLHETWHGIEHYHTIRELAGDPTDRRMEDLAADLTAIARLTFVGPHVQVAVAADHPSMDFAAERARSLRRSLPRGGPRETDAIPQWLQEEGTGSVREGWATSTAVSFVATAFKTVRMGHPHAPVLAVAAKLLRSLYLHTEIREKGGAYGAMASTDAEDGILWLASYRDPHIVRTVNVFENGGRFLAQGSYSLQDVKEAVLQTCSEIDRPEAPGSAARKAFYRSILGLSDTTRQEFKSGVLAVTRASIMEVAEAYVTPRSALPLAVVSNEPSLRDANDSLTQSPLQIHSL